MTTPEADKILVQCACGAKLRAPATSVGKQFECPKCGSHVTIPAPESAPLASGPAVDPAPPLPVASPKACPECQAIMQPAAVVCTACGLNTQTGTTANPESTSTGKGAALAKATGTFVLGVILSATGAAVGGVAWFLAVWHLNVEVGYIAWGIGVLAGLGMTLGSRNPSTTGGVVAAGMSVLGVVGAKVAIFSFLISAFFLGQTDDLDVQREFVTGMMANEILDARGIEGEEQRDKQWNSANIEAELRVKSLSDDEIRAKWQEYRDQIEDQVKAAKTTEEQAESDGDGMFSFFISTQFSVFDLLWLFLAIGSAYKIGSGKARPSET
ncbi:MAG: hypothetical protein ABII12_17105 [Planctomycetota bacterium]